MASGTPVRLHRCVFSPMFTTEIPALVAVRRPVSFSETVYEKTWTVKGLGEAERRVIRSGTQVIQGLTIGDVNSRECPAYCATISEKARAIAGGVWEAILMRSNTRKINLS